MWLCIKCRKVFDLPGIKNPYGACSWHPGELKVWGLGIEQNYDDAWKWTCCGESGRSWYDPVTQKDVFPDRSPGCQSGPHVPDHKIVFSDDWVREEIRQLDEGHPDHKGQKRELFIANSISSQAKNASIDYPVKLEGALFISYTHADKSLVDQLANRLELEKIQYWRDYAEMVVGESIRDIILKGIDRSLGLLLIASPVALRSTWVQLEIAAAVRRRVEATFLILPLLCGGATYSDLPAELHDTFAADFNGSFEEGMKVLLRSISKSVGSLKT